MSLHERSNEPAELRIVQDVCDAFGLGPITAINDVGGTRNKNLACQTSLGHWLLRRRHEAYSCLEQLKFDHSVANFLNHSRVSVPTPLTAKFGATWWQGRNQTWEAYSFVQGESLQSGQPGQTASLGKALGHWHRAGRIFTKRYLKGGPRGETTPALLLSRAERIDSESPAARSIVEAYRHQVDEAANKLTDERWASLPHTLIHGDVQPANLLMRDGELAAFVDLDWCCWQARIYDLCFAILICCAIHEEEFDGSNIWSLTQTPHFVGDATRAFLTAYEDAAGALSPEEWSTLPVQLTLTLCHARLAGALKVEPQQRLAFLERPPLPLDTSWMPGF